MGEDCDAGAPHPPASPFDRLRVRMGVAARRPTYSALAISSAIFFASENSIIVLSR